MEGRARAPRRAPFPLASGQDRHAAVPSLKRQDPLSLEPPLFRTKALTVDTSECLLMIGAGGPGRLATSTTGVHSGAADPRPTQGEY